MSKTLYLKHSHARTAYTCAACGDTIRTGNEYYRHEPHPYARMRGGERSSHWCAPCVSASNPIFDGSSGRYRVGAVLVIDAARSRKRILQPAQIQLLSIGDVLREQLRLEPTLIHQLTPEQFEDLVCDRLFAMGFEPKKVGSTYQRDGGIDVLFWPRGEGAFPLLGAAQVKHHKSPRVKTGPTDVRAFAGVLGGHQFAAAMLVTNTSFSPDALWFAREHASFIRLRDFSDLRRWLFDNFADDAEWREIPSELEVCPGVRVKIR